MLAGAGCSTESGIPDYRGPEGRLRTRAPVQYGDFVRSAATRRRYWGRSAIGWSRVGRARPNPAHIGIAELERAGLVTGVITQNVDGLHQAAGSRAVIELHGTLSRVVCLQCGRTAPRDQMQERLEAANPGWVRQARPVRSAPDGDADVEEGFADFVVPACDVCGGVIKPDVVFFGESVPKPRVARSWAMLDSSDVLLVVGSSLTVYSGRRFIYGAAERRMPVAVMNLGPTRADDVARVKVDARLGETVPRLVDALTPTGG